MSAEKEPDLKSLAKALSESYSSLLKYSSLPDNAITNHLSQLAKYSSHLPLSWFTSSLIQVLVVLNDRFRKQQQYPALASIYTLWAVWTRRLSGSPTDIQNADPQLSNVLGLMRELLLSDLPPTALAIRKDAWIGLVALVGRCPPGFPEAKLIEAMTDIIDRYAEQPDICEAMGETFDAGVAHCLAQTTMLNELEMDHCQRLLEAEVKMVSGREAGIRSLMTVMEHTVDVRSQQKPQTRAEADLQTLVRLADTILQSDPLASLPIRMTRMAILAGILRMLQFTQGPKTKKVKALRNEAETLYVRHLDALVTDILKPEQVHQFDKYQDIILIFVGQCIPNIPSKALRELHLPSLLHVCVSALLTNHRTWNNGQFLYNLKNTKETVQHLNDLVDNALFKDIGRVSRAIGNIVRAMLESNSEDNAPHVQEVLDRLVAFSYNVLISWDRFILEHPESLMNEAEKQTLKNLDTAILSILKAMLFAFTAIVKTVAVDVSNGEGLLAVQYSAQDILSIYANLQFVTDKLGSGTGFQAYQDTLTNAVAYLTHEDHLCQLNRFISLAFREYAPQQFINDPTHPTDILSPGHTARLTFFTNLIEQVMKDIDDTILENDILPVIYPVLKWRKIKNKELYESAHAAMLSIFAAEKPVSREVAGVYANILIESFPEPMTHHQLRFAYTTMIQSLCAMDDALAWLTVARVLEKLRTLESEQDTVLQSQYTVVLIDLLKPMSLGPFLGKLLQEIEYQVLKQETPNAREATLKIIFEVVSGTGISDMRRVEAVGWFLDLKRRVAALSTHKYEEQKERK
ncbi:uncharacterized protein BYT42DRAFT_552311 [Radiomyces spectabilis]|uniref:uncharacterized protein n=1 Tax=Radiomyces spectabilis TaxID=64574 RepID=UPI00221E5075|nr:uncharacterized protein BYT42DRAFT_552311 [Radiomyces spectabilis]KAI8393813.1 hypothetical protein BYT42DRAFT_552311 [Radiomyces spectabilis]